VTKEQKNSNATNFNGYQVDKDYIEYFDRAILDGLEPLIFTEWLEKMED